MSSLEVVEEATPSTPTRPSTSTPHPPPPADAETAAAANDDVNDNDADDHLRHLPSQFNLFFPSTEHEFNDGEAAMKAAILQVTAPLGIRSLSIEGKGSATNKDVDTKGKFPHKRFRWICGSCKQKEREDCGFWIRLLLQDKIGEKEPFLQVMELQLPPTSKHLLVSEEDRQKSASKAAIVHEAELTPKKTALLKSLGEERVSAQTAQNIVRSQCDGLQLGTQLVNRVMKKGRDERWGADDNESMLLFYAEGLKLHEEDSELGVAGKFTTTHAENNGVLVSWAEQMPIEVLNARVYGVDAVWADTTHNATKFSLKTAPVSVADWGGHTAPAGFYQVREEEIESCGTMHALLELDSPGATLATDGGPAWPAIAERFGQNHIEDTWHNEENGDKKVNKLAASAKNAFKKLKNKVMYGVHVQEVLTGLFAKMREVISQSLPIQTADSKKASTNPKKASTGRQKSWGDTHCKQALKWIDRMEKGQATRTATHTTKHFCCSDKGATSRCEVGMSRLKGAGKRKAKMRKWRLPELQRRHREYVENYMQTAKKFFGVSQSSKRETIVINIERPSTNGALGITVVYKEVSNEVSETEGLGRLEVTAIAPESPCHNSKLQIGMMIQAVNGDTFSSQEDGLRLISTVQGHFTLLADTVPLLGTTYKICDRNDASMEHTVFIPDSTQNGVAVSPHCQSDFHVHTSFLARDRFIQRALMEHPKRSMKDETTMHSRWHIKKSPLYKPVYDNLVATMKIEGLGDAALPAFLTDATSRRVSPAVAAAMNVANDSDEEDSIEDYSIRRISVPNSESARYNQANTLAGRIVEIAKKDPEVFRMVMPQFQQMYQNSMMMRKTKSSKSHHAKNAVAAAKVHLPVVPESIQRDKSDDVNLANTTKKKKESKGGGKKKRRKC
jgi:hypothetical protein